MPTKNDTGGYEFTFGNGASHAVFSGDNGAFILIVMTNIKNAPDDFMSMLKSIQLKQEVTQEEPAQKAAQEEKQETQKQEEQPETKQ